MRLPLFDALAPHPAGQRVVAQRPLKHIAAYTDRATVDFGVRERYFITARFTASVLTEPGRHELEAISIEVAKRAIAREVFGPIEDLARDAEYALYDGDIEEARGILKTICALVRGEDVSLR